MSSLTSVLSNFHGSDSRLYLRRATHGRLTRICNFLYLRKLAAQQCWHGHGTHLLGGRKHATSVASADSEEPRLWCCRQPRVLLTRQNVACYSCFAGSVIHICSTPATSTPCSKYTCLIPQATQHFSQDSPSIDTIDADLIYAVRPIRVPPTSLPTSLNRAPHSARLNLNTLGVAHSVVVFLPPLRLGGAKKNSVISTDGAVPSIVYAANLVGMVASGMTTAAAAMATTKWAMQLKERGLLRCLAHARDCRHPGHDRGT